jgi:hypothetical protein
VIVRTPEFASCECGVSYITLSPSGLANHIPPATPAGETRPSLRVIEGGQDA